jgi:hypothetical protein
MLELAAGSLQGFLDLVDHTRALGPVELQSGFADSLLADSLPHVVAEKIHCNHLRLAVVHLTLNLRQLQIRRPAQHRPASSFRRGPMQLEEQRQEQRQEQCQVEKRMGNVLGAEQNHPGQDSLGEAVVLVARTWFWTGIYVFERILMTLRSQIEWNPLS